MDVPASVSSFRAVALSLLTAVAVSGADSVQEVLVHRSARITAQRRFRSVYRMVRCFRQHFVECRPTDTIPVIAALSLGNQ